MYKYTIPQILPWIIPSITWKVETRDKLVHLTFDDGPHPDITPWVIDQLRQYDARATFFCVGENVVKFPEVFEMVVQAGHQVGNHTFNHIDGWKTGNKTYFENIEKCAQVVPGNLFRPPFGKIKFSQIRHLKNKYRIIMWSILSRDFEKDLDTDHAFKYITENLQPGSVIVFHDSVKAKDNLKVLLPDLLNHLREEGFEMKSL